MVEDTRKLGTVKVLIVKGRDGETQDISGKADKVSSATNGDLAGLNASGNLTDSGIAASKVVQTSNTSGLLKNDGSVQTLPLPIASGGTGNTDGYIRTGIKANTTVGTRATAEGYNTTASHTNAHAEGDGTVASAQNTHAEGRNSVAAGQMSHAEGADTETTSTGLAGHAEGGYTSVSGNCGHAEGFHTTASGDFSHAAGIRTTAGQNNQTVVGIANSNKSTTLFEVGNGTVDSAGNDYAILTQSNAFEVYSDGKFSQDNGSTKFKFGNNGTSDGYYDASGTFHAFGSGGGSSIRKTRYTISSSSWSASANASGYYTYSLTLNPTLSTSFCPNVSISGSGDSTIWTDTQKSMYDLVDYYNNTSANTLVLYAKTKPTSTFYIYVEGVNN